MNERIDQLEAELSAMRPKGVSPQLAGKLDANLNEPRRPAWSDRVLVFAMSMGALAACIIIALLAFDARYVAPPPQQNIVVRAADHPVNAFALARTSRLWCEAVN